jgi:hypothetical protein
MKALAILAMCGALAAFSGCAAPRIETPSVFGRVVKAGSGEPVDMAAVIVGRNKRTAVFTRRDGSFETEEISKPGAVSLWPWAKRERKKFTLYVARPGYGKAEKRIEWDPNQTRSVHLGQPIELESKGSRATIGELLSR